MIPNRKNLKSVHVFMFPFQWDCTSCPVKDDRELLEQPYDERTDLKKIGAKLTNIGWVRSPFMIPNDLPESYAEAYNEFTYFYKHVRNVIYDLSDAEGANYLDYYEFPVHEKDYFEIVTRKGTYKLTLKGISLHAYSTGVGIISFSLLNYDYSELTDILNINDFGRRIYPQYLNDKGNLEGANYSFLAKQTTLCVGGRVITEDYTKYNFGSNWINENRPFVPPSYLEHLLSSCIFGMSYGNAKDDIIVQPLLDDRMFFLSWFGNDEFSERLKFDDILTKEDWYQYVFGDNDGVTLKNDEMLNEHLKLHTYQRWSKYGTLYGLTRDSFVVASSTLDEYKPPIDKHTLSMYYQIVTLCLAQRSSVVRFANEISHIQDLARYKHKSDAATKKINDIYLNYIEFVNKLYFREVTSQIQGIELYAQLQKVMGLKDEVKDLDNEIQELNTYAESTQNSQLTMIAGYFLPATFVAGVLGMNLLNGDDTDFKVPTWIGMLLIISTFFFSKRIIHSINRYKK